MFDRAVTQMELSQLLGYDPSIICRICQGQQTPSLEMAMRISKILNAKVEHLWPLNELERLRSNRKKAPRK